MWKACLICLLLLCYAHADDDCLDWFVKSKIPPKTKDCITNCNLITTDMGTFMCSDRCDEFCNPPPKCKPDPFWLTKLKSGRPDNWQNPSEASIEWTKQEKERVLAALSQLPNALKLGELKGIFKMKKSIELINPSTEINNAVVLYDSAFNGPFSLNRVLAHELAHILYESWTESKRLQFLKAAGWKLNRYNGEFSPADSRHFVTSDAKDSPGEDFAHDLDTYLFEPNALSKAAPQILKWIKLSFPKSFGLKMECNDDSKSH